MAHVQGAGSTRQGVNVPGKRRGVKVYGGSKAISGNIIVRQKGTKFHPGEGVKMGRDFTIYAVREGFVDFRRMTGTKRGKFWVDVVPKAKAAAKPATKAKSKAKTTKNSSTRETNKKTAKSNKKTAKK